MSSRCCLRAERTWHLAQHPDPAVRRCDVTVPALPAQVRIAANGLKARVRRAGRR